MARGKLLTEKEIEYILSHHKTQTPTKIANVLQRPKSTIRGYLARNGLFRVTQEQKANVLKNFLDKIEI